MTTRFSRDPADQIIVALDGMAPEQALAFVRAVPDLRWVKVGLELFVAGGPDVVRQLRDQGQRVFLDLKFHDIPATMAGACRSAARLKPPWLAASGLPVDGATGRVLCEPTLQVQGHPQLFASGDCALVASAPRPPSGVWAVRATQIIVDWRSVAFVAVHVVLAAVSVILAVRLWQQASVRR